jgi:hypothetical protein
MYIVRGTVSTHGYYALLKVLKEGNKSTHFTWWLLLPHVQIETIDLMTRFSQSHYLLLDCTFYDHIDDVAVGLPLALVIANLWAQAFAQVSFVQCEKRQSTARVCG